MRILYSDAGLVACIKPVGLDSESELPAALKEQLGTGWTKMWAV